MSWSIRKLKNTWEDDNSNNNNLGPSLVYVIIPFRRLEEIVNNLDKKLKNNFDMTFASFKTEEILNEIKRLELSIAGCICSILLERLTTLTDLLKQIKDVKRTTRDNHKTQIIRTKRLKA